MGAAGGGWLGRTLRPKKAPIPRAAALRAGLAVAARVAAGDDRTAGLRRRPGVRGPLPARRHRAARPGAGRRWRRTLAGVLTSAGTWSHACRLALCTGVAVALVSVAGVPHSYWVPMTVTFVLKPDFGSVFGRAVLRAAGTLAGVAVGGALLLLVPRGWPTVPVVFVLAALARIGLDRSNAMTTTAITPLILILVESAVPAPLGDVLPARLLDTLMGCGIVLVAGYALWPGSWRVRVRDGLADTVTAACPPRASRALPRTPRDLPFDRSGRNGRQATAWARVMPNQAAPRPASTLAATLAAASRRAPLSASRTVS